MAHNLSPLRIWGQWNIRSDSQLKEEIKYLSPSDLDLSDRIIGIRVRNCWIGHGFWAGLGSFFTCPLAGSSITHWWVEIETEKGWYCAQFGQGNILRLSKHYSLSEVTEEGKGAANARGENKNITTKKTDKPSSRTMADVVQFMEEYNGCYDLILNNCQDFALALYIWI